MGGHGVRRTMRSRPAPLRAGFPRPACPDRSPEWASRCGSTRSSAGCYRGTAAHGSCTRSEASYPATSARRRCTRGSSLHAAKCRTASHPQRIHACKAIAPRRPRKFRPEYRPSLRGLPAECRSSAACFRHASASRGRTGQARRPDAASRCTCLFPRRNCTRGYRASHHGRAPLKPSRLPPSAPWN